MLARAMKVRVGYRRTVFNFRGNCCKRAPSIPKERTMFSCSTRMLCVVLATVTKESQYPEWIKTCPDLEAVELSR